MLVLSAKNCLKKQIGNDLWGIELSTMTSRDPEGQGRDPQYA